MSEIPSCGTSISSPSTTALEGQPALPFTPSPLHRVTLSLLVSLSLSLLFSPASADAAQPTTTQLIPLNAGWNLISIQVGDTPYTPATFQASLSDPSRLIEIWGYTPTGDPVVPGTWQTYQPTEPSFPSDLATIQQGRGYWVNVSQATTLSLTGVPWNGTVQIVKGWNLLGFPGVAFEDDEIQELASVFGSAFDRIQQVWTFDTATQTFAGYDLTAVPQLRDLTEVLPGQGYWVYSIADTTLDLAPDPYLALPADSDASPPQSAEPFQAADFPSLPNPADYVGRDIRKPGAGDTEYDLNANGILDDAYTQNTILYEKASEAIPITIGNSGSGTLTWVLENPTDWIFTAPADKRTWGENVATRPRLASGTVSSEKDTLILFADRTGMTPGRKSGDSVTLWIGGEAHVIHLLIDVPEIDGDWKGYATTTRVGGKDITLGEVRLALNAFRPDPIGLPTSFRAVLNREEAILFPRDVYMDGIFFNGEQFKLTTNFSMPAGDRNAPPYNTFTHTTPDDFPGDPAAQKKAARGDKDFDGDGKVDVMNPFPFGLRREVTLIGRRVSPNRLEGSYVEAIRGMLPPVGTNDLPAVEEKFLDGDFLTTSQPVFIEGTFVLERETFEPAQRSVFNETVEPEVTVGGTGSGTRTEILSVTTSATVQGVVVGIDLDLGNVDPALLRITLFSPTGSFYTLHDFADTFAGEYTLPNGTFQGDDTAGDWLLVIEWDDTSGERATLHSWSLNVEGSSTHAASGRIVRTGTLTPEPGVAIRIEGGVTTLSTTTAADGTFSFAELTENDYTLVITKPGFQPQNVTFFVGEEDKLLGDIELTPLTVTEPAILGAPLLGYEPLYTEFQMLVPLDYGAANISWDFGDGTPVEAGTFADLVAPSHIYTSAGVFTPVATLSGGTLPSPVVVNGPVAHVHRRIAASGGGTHQVVAGIFMGSVAARMDVGANTPAAEPFSLTDEQTTFTEGMDTVTMNSATVYQESQWDSATFDINRSDAKHWPPPDVPIPATTTFNYTLEDSDYGRSGDLTSGGQTFIYYNTAASDNQSTPHDEKWDARAWSQPPLQTLPAGSLYQSPGTYETFTPATPARPSRLRMKVTLGGYTLGTETLPLGDVNLFPGRTLR